MIADVGSGFNGKFVQELLGRATIAITLDTYSHVIPALHINYKRLREAVVCSEPNYHL